MSTSGKEPTVVAGRDGPTEGPYSNAARIAAVKAKTQAFQKRKRRGPYKPRAPKPERDIHAERVEAYSDLESLLCDCVNMGTIAAHLACAGEGDLAQFALRKRYYSKGFAK